MDGISNIGGRPSTSNVGGSRGTGGTTAANATGGDVTESRTNGTSSFERDSAALSRPGRESGLSLSDLDSSAPTREATMAASRRGDPGAVLANAQNIVDATEGRFREDFIAQYKSENGGKTPSSADVKEAYNDQFLKAFVNARYPSFVEQDSVKDNIGGHGIPFAGFDPDNLNPAFKSPEVMEMLQSFPNTYRPSPGAEPISVNHLLSGLQFQATSADSIPNWITKQTIGTAVNSHVAETVLKDRRSQEKSFGGIDAAYSRDLQKTFIEQGPVQGLKSFFDNPAKHIDAGRNNVAINPLSLIQRGYGYIINAVRD